MKKKYIAILAKDAADAIEAKRKMGFDDNIYYFLLNEHVQSWYSVMDATCEYQGVLYKDYWNNPEFENIFCSIFTNKTKRDVGDGNQFLDAVQKTYDGPVKNIQLSQPFREVIQLKPKSKPQKTANSYIDAGVWGITASSNWKDIPKIASGATTNLGLDWNNSKIIPR